MAINRLSNYSLVSCVLSGTPKDYLISLKVPESYFRLVRAKSDGQLTRDEVRVLEKVVRMHNLSPESIWN